MVATKSIDVRDNFKDYCEKVFNGETLIISRPRNENVIMISEKSYNDLQKELRNASYLKMLDDSLKEVESGNIVVNTISDLRKYE